jgi:hypothetical protein
VHCPTEVVAGEQIHMAVADDRGGGEPVEHPLQARPRCPPLAGAAAETPAIAPRLSLARHPPRRGRRPRHGAARVLSERPCGASPPAPG